MSSLLVLYSSPIINRARLIRILNIGVGVISIHQILDPSNTHTSATKLWAIQQALMFTKIHIRTRKHSKIKVNFTQIKDITDKEWSLMRITRKEWNTENPWKIQAYLYLKELVQIRNVSYIKTDPSHHLVDQAKKTPNLEVIIASPLPNYWKKRWLTSFNSLI